MINMNKKQIMKLRSFKNLINDDEKKSEEEDEEEKERKKE